MSAALMSKSPKLNVLNDADKHRIQQDIAKIKSDSENSSKIVDENGEPLVVYHGSSADFTVFDHRSGYRDGAGKKRLPESVRFFLCSA